MEEPHTGRTIKEVVLEELEEPVREAPSRRRARVGIRKRLEDEVIRQVDFSKDLESQLNRFITVDNPSVRTATLSLLTEAPEGMNIDAPAWKIWKISSWVAHNIQYISDPTAMDYWAYPEETLQSRAGDCDDLATLISTMFEIVGLDAALAFIDTNSDGVMDHVACMVYYPGTAEEFLEEVGNVLKKLGKETPTKTLSVRHYKTSDLSGGMGARPLGIWIFIDPLFGDVKDVPGSITQKAYVVMQIVDVGYRKKV